MGGMVCSICKSIIVDHDGSVVYDVFTKDWLNEYNSKYLKLENPKLLDITLYSDYELSNYYFWKCNKCQAVYVWNLINDDSFSFHIKTESIDKNIDLEAIKSMTELFIINNNDNIDDLFIKDLFVRNPFRPYKYYISKDLKVVYIINTDINYLDRIYERD